jgi:hypothetical protein
MRFSFKRKNVKKKRIPTYRRQNSNFVISNIDLDVNDVDDGNGDKL